MSEESTARQGSWVLVKEKVDLFFQKVGSLSRKQRLLICIATFAIIGGGYYYFFLSPRLDQIKSLKKEYKSLSDKLVIYKRKAASLSKFEKKLKAAEDEFHTALLALPDKKEIPSLLTAISNSGNDSGLEFLLFKPEAERKKDFYAEIPVSIEVTGGYHQIAEFFDRISRLSRLVNLQDVVMDYSSKGEALTVSCKALTYMFVEESQKQETLPSSKKGKRRRRK